MCAQLSTEGSQATPLGTTHQQKPPVASTTTAFLFLGKSIVYSTVTDIVTVNSVESLITSFFQTMLLYFVSFCSYLHHVVHRY